MGVGAFKGGEDDDDDEEEGSELSATASGMLMPNLIDGADIVGWKFK
jgi:hypothetical protein